MLKYEPTTKEYYHDKMLELPKTLRAMIDAEINSDNYYLVIKEHDIVGGFTTNLNGELQVLFSLVKGLGKDIFKLRLEVANIDKMASVNKFKLFCIGDKLRTLYELYGFKVTEVVKWDEQYAPDNWDYERFGTPDLYYMDRDTSIQNKYIVGSVEGLLGVFTEHKEAFKMYEACNIKIKGVFQLRDDKLRSVNVSAGWFSVYKDTSISEHDYLKMSITKDLTC